MEKEQKIVVLRIIISMLLFGLSFLPFFGEIETLIISLVAYIIIGYKVIYNACKNIMHAKIFDENFLMLVATVGALIIGDYREAVAVMLFYEIGELLQDLAVDNSKKSITKLMDLKPDYANLFHDDVVIKVNPTEVKVNDIIIINPGEKIPLDGLIIEGKSSLNTMALTGESLPKEVDINDSVSSGCINLTGTIKVRVTKIYSESTVAKILELIVNADNNKANAEKYITKFAKIYTPTVVGLALIIAILPPLILGGLWVRWISRALTFLIVSCPCALVVSIPLSFFAGIGGASKKGVLIKGANYIEVLTKVNIVAFDKTGTLTKGNFKVAVIHPNKISEEQLFEICVLAENNSSHPIAQAIISAYSRKIDIRRISDIKNLAGFGIKAIIDGKETYIGNERLMREHEIEVPDCKHVGTLIHVAIENVYMGHIEIIDEIKDDSKNSIALLKSQNIDKTIMLTGDKESVAAKISNDLGIDCYYAELTPADKVEKLKELQQNNKIVAFVGDGINDAPVLNLANVGIAMGGLGSDAAIESADIVIMDDNPIKISKSISIAKKTMRLVKENIIFALGIKIAMLILGAFGLIGMWLAVFADVGVSLIAIANSLRGLKNK